MFDQNRDENIVGNGTIVVDNSFSHNVFKGLLRRRSHMSSA